MQLVLAQKITELPNVVTFVWTAPEPFSWKAGQFLKYTLPHPGADDRGESRWFTICAAPFEGSPRITTRISSADGSSFKAALLALKPGQTIEASGPMGGFVLADPTAPFVMVAGGIGITPYLAMLRQMHHDGVQIRGQLLYANRTDQIPYKSEFDNLAQAHKGFEVQYFVGDHQITIDDLTASGTSLGEPIFYLSGPEPMVGHFEQQLFDAGIEPGRVKTDYFPGYNS